MTALNKTFEIYLSSYKIKCNIKIKDYCYFKLLVNSETPHGMNSFNVTQ